MIVRFLLVCEGSSCSSRRFHRTSTSPSSPSQPISNQGSILTTQGDLFRGALQAPEWCVPASRLFFYFCLPALEALPEGSFLVIDELDTRLHPDLSRAFLSLFHREATDFPIARRRPSRGLCPMLASVLRFIRGCNTELL